MTTSPQIPEEQRSFTDRGAPSVEDAVDAEGRRDLRSGTRSGEAGYAAVNPRAQTRYGDLKQNLTNQWRVQER